MEAAWRRRRSLLLLVHLARPGWLWPHLTAWGGAMRVSRMKCSSLGAVRRGTGRCVNAFARRRPSHGEMHLAPALVAGECLPSPPRCQGRTWPSHAGCMSYSARVARRALAVLRYRLPWPRRAGGRALLRALLRAMPLTAEMQQQHHQRRVQLLHQRPVQRRPLLSPLRVQLSGSATRAHCAIVRLTRSAVAAAPRAPRCRSHRPHQHRPTY